MNEVYFSGCDSIRIIVFSVRRGDMNNMTESNIQSTDHWALQPNPSISVEPIQALNRSVRCFTLTLLTPFIISCFISSSHQEIKIHVKSVKNNKPLMIIMWHLIDPCQKIDFFFFLPPSSMKRSEVGGQLQSSTPEAGGGRVKGCLALGHFSSADRWLP